MRPVVVTVCGDPGGGAALIPVLEKLAQEQRVVLRPYAYRQSVQLLQARELAPTVIPATVDASWFEEVLRSTGAALVLTATSHNGEDHEKAFISAARQLGIPSCAVLDFWSNYGVRFSNSAGELAHVPDRIAVMDEAAREGLIAAGIPAERIVVTGHPAFDALAEQRSRFGPREREAVRALTGTDPQEVQVLFASQPLGALYGVDASSSTFLGYDERSVLDQLLAALEDFARSSGKRLVLVIRPHPREELDAHAARQSRVVRIVVSRAGDAREMAMASELVTGMTTMLLVEARQLGCPAVSLQPGRRVPDIFSATVSCGLYSVSRPEEVGGTIAALLEGSRRAPPAATMAGAGEATRHVVDEVYSLLPREQCGAGR